jgi:predicted HicB family RNase H-like nuclease
MNTMTYKGYTARVEYDERDNIFVGRILGIRNMISFHGETVAELRTEFELSVKDYLADCEQQGLPLKSRLPASCCCAYHLRCMVVLSLLRRLQARA